MYDLLSNVRAKVRELQHKKNAILGRPLLELKGWEVRTGHSCPTYFQGQTKGRFKYIVCAKTTKKIVMMYESYLGELSIDFYQTDWSSTSIEEDYFKKYGIHGWGATEEEAISEAVKGL